MQRQHSTAQRFPEALCSAASLAKDERSASPNNLLYYHRAIKSQAHQKVRRQVGEHVHAWMHRLRRLLVR